MKRLFAVLVGCLIAAYPFIVFYGLQSFPLSYVGMLLITIALLRLWVVRDSIGKSPLPLALTLVLILVISVVFDVSEKIDDFYTTSLASLYEAGRFEQEISDCDIKSKQPFNMGEGRPPTCNVGSSTSWP